MEHLTFNALGQWSLNKSTKLDFKDYRRGLHLRGELPQDRGRKGQLHSGSNSQPPRTTSQPKMEGKVPVPSVSSYEVRNPSLEDDSPSPKIDNI